MKKLGSFGNERGSVLMTSVGLVLVMMAMGICLSRISTDELNHATLKIKKEAANIAAETGWLVAANWLESHNPPVDYDITAQLDTFIERPNNLVGELNNTAHQPGMPVMPTQYDAEVDFLGTVYPEGSDTSKYTAYEYAITSDGYVSRDFQAKGTRAQIRQAGRLTEITATIMRIKLK